jgi:hypothetical protein
MAVERRSIVKFEQDLQKDIEAAQRDLSGLQDQADNLEQQMFEVRIKLETLKYIAGRLEKPANGDEAEA